MTLPKTMRAIEITQPGGPEVLRLVERPIPALAAGEVLVKVAAAGINRADLSQRQGAYPPPPGASDLPGLEISGSIESLGAGVQGWRPGDAVCALLTGGGYAEYCAVPAGQCLPVPGGLTLIEAAAIPEACFTVWTMVWDRARLASGESLLVQGGSSGIGVMAIQMAVALGHRVFVTAGSEEKCAACVALGAERAINYRTQDFVAEVQAATAGRGVDVILDMVGGDYVKREVAALADDGRLVFIASLGGAEAGFNVREVMRRRLTITGATLRARPLAFKEAIARNLRKTIWPLLESGRIRPVIQQTFPLAQAADAHRLMEAGGHTGKILLVV